MHGVNDINYTAYSSRKFCGVFDLLNTRGGTEWRTKNRPTVS